MNTTVLELEFKDISGKSYTLKIDDPRENLTGGDLVMATDEILSAKVLTNRGTELSEIAEARTVTKTVTKINID